jgi:ParB family chromosome partitioning protein
MTEKTEINRKIAFEIFPEDVKIIGLDTEDGEEHPLWDKRATLPVNEAMAQRMVITGWTHGAIELHKNKEEKRYEVIVGRQRIKALRRANELREANGLERFKAVAFFKDLEVADAADIMIAENEIRENDSPIDKADKVWRYMNRFGKSHKDAALTFGVSVQTIKLWLKASKLIEPVQQAIRDGKISFNAALELANMSEEEQATHLEEMPEGEGQFGEVTKKQIKGQKDKKETGEAVEKPTTTKIKRVLAANREEQFLSDDFVLALKWVLGTVGDSRIKGMAAAVRPPEKKKKKEAEAAE